MFENLQNKLLLHLKNHLPCRTRRKRYYSQQLKHVYAVQRIPCSIQITLLTNVVDLITVVAFVVEVACPFGKIPNMTKQISLCKLSLLLIFAQLPRPSPRSTSLPIDHNKGPVRNIRVTNEVRQFHDNRSYLPIYSVPVLIAVYLTLSCFLVNTVYAGTFADVQDDQWLDLY